MEDENIGDMDQRNSDLLNLFTRQTPVNKNTPQITKQNFEITNKRYKTKKLRTETLESGLSKSPKSRNYMNDTESVKNS